MKKLIVGLLMTVMIGSLAACGGKNQTGAGTDTSAVSEAAKEADAESKTSETETTYEPGTWDGVTYANTSLGMYFTLPDGWQIGTQEQIDAVESAGQQVTGNTENTGDTSNYEFYIFNPNTGSTIAMMTEDLSMFGDVTAQEYANTLAEQLMSYTDQGITYSFNGITDSVIGTSPFVSFAGMAEYQGSYIYQYYAITENGGRMITVIATGPAEAGQAECEAVLASIQPLQ
ncbi:hypothetical protein [uncultured Eubacterium sp.]|uniref:hypothetical protein n=1 Tax=uncultured Eubacterium sp. TaxID=165185 RepID=UPI0025D308D3|nr:hypothetical protein [uncultured Eubacterium sp.]MCI6537316.1 hypothetical protein [Lachnospiraceae bacterium]